MIRAACTIISFNYLPYARTLCESFLLHHPDSKFYVLLVDRLPAGFDRSKERFELIAVEDLGIPDFPSIAFKYDILELNTNVKPTFLKYLLARGVEELVYLDPDISVFRYLQPVFDALEDHSIALTPHSLSPVGAPEEVVLLSAGVFNLGFIGLRACAATDTFLSWWEDRCLNMAYDEQKTGLFVDQKWINLVPCFFESVKILRHTGCNVAYWNLHERTLAKDGDSIVVNGVDPLIFFHFSGVSVDGGDRVSKYTERYSLTNRPDLKVLFEGYRAKLIENGIRDKISHQYAFGSFENGSHINRLARSLYAAQVDRFGTSNPFSTNSEFYRWAVANRILSSKDSVKSYTSRSYSKEDVRARILNKSLRLLLRSLGADRYTVLMKYLSHFSTLRNQKDIFDAS